MEGCQYRRSTIVRELRVVAEFGRTDGGEGGLYAALNHVKTCTNPRCARMNTAINEAIQLLQDLVEEREPLRPEAKIALPAGPRAVDGANGHTPAAHT